MAQKKRASGRKKGTARNAKNTNTNDYFALHIIISALCSLFLGIFLYTGRDAIVNNFVRESLNNIIGTVSYIIPFSLAAATVYLGITKSVREYWRKFVLTALTLVVLASIIQLITAQDVASVAASYGNGGIIGAFFAVTLVKLVQKAGAYVILTLLLLILIGALVGVSTLRIMAEGIKRAFIYVKNTFYDFREDIDYEYEDEDKKSKRTEKTLKNTKLSDKEKAEILAAANSSAEELLSKKKPTEKKAADKKAKKAADEAENLDVIENADGFDNDIDNGIDKVFSNFKIADETDNIIVSDAKTSKAYSEEMQNNADVESKADSPEKAKNMTETERKKFNNEFDEAIEKEIPPYEYPPIDMLKNVRLKSTDKRAELRETATKLIKVLEDFGVRATLLQVTQGPAVTRYEIQPETGVKLSKITGLANDIAMNLAVSNILIAPVPGKAAVGIEIPNNKVSSVNIRELIESPDFQNSKSKLTFALGKDIGGGIVIGDIAKMPHLLIAGATGSGKSVCINTIIMSLLYKSSPEEVKLIMVDPKVVELSVYNGIPHLLVPVVTDPKKAAGALNWAVAEMMRRYDLFKETGVRKLEAYNKLMESTGGNKVPQLVIIIDELADLMMVAAKEVEDYICRLAQLARAAGIHLIVATQRPSVDVITGLIKANIPSRIAFAVSGQVDSRTILDKGGAEKLLGMGDMLYHPTGARDARRVQGAFVSDDEIESVLNFIRETSGENNHYSEDLAEQIERCATGENGVTPDADDDGDALLPTAIELAVEMGKISTSMVQRRLGVGYSRAGRIIDQMEARGIISGANGSKPRDVLINYADMSANNTADEE